jgi:transcriptional regulator with PAS, ATPase and Fis domain
VLGTVYLDSRSRVIGFNDDDLRFLEAFAQHAATALDNAGMLRALKKENLTLRQQVLERYSFANIVGRSPAMQEVFETLKTVSASPLAVLIRGESGTGKELVARALHYNSLRKSNSFLSENCAAFPENLLESQLFGHVRGAFTGATTDQAGLFQEANHGTLFLDEIGEMSPSLQARLTRVLESGELRPIGAAQPVQVDVRLIGATHRNLEEMVAAGTFRNDLLFRLNVITIDLPPLRERRDDIPLLVSHFIEELSKELGTPAPGISDGALELLTAREWRGNVRQLRNEISRLLVFHRGDVITADQVRELSPAASPLLDEYLDPSGESVALKDLEKRHILRALQETQGDRTRAARLLRLGRATIFRKIKDYDLDA